MIARHTRRRFLQGATGGIAGLAAWLQSWPRLLAAPASKDGPSGQMTRAVHITIAPHMVRLGRGAGGNHVIDVPVRHPRRAGETDARQPDVSEPCHTME